MPLATRTFALPRPLLSTKRSLKSSCKRQLVGKLCYSRPTPCSPSLVMVPALPREQCTAAMPPMSCIIPSNDIGSPPNNKYGSAPPNPPIQISTNSKPNHRLLGGAAPPQRTYFVMVVWLGLVWLGFVWLGLVFCLAWFGFVWLGFGLAWFCLGFGLVWLVLAWG